MAKYDFTPYEKRKKNIRFNMRLSPNVKWLLSEIQKKENEKRKKDYSRSLKGESQTIEECIKKIAIQNKIIKDSDLWHF